MLRTPHELFAYELRKMLWVEEKLAQEILPELFEQVHAVDLKYAVERHLLETRAHVRRLRSALHLLGERGEPEQSAALLGLRDEHAQLYEHVDAGRDEVVDLVHADAIAKTEHLEIAAYTRLRSTANALGEEEIAMMLQEVLEQEKHALELAERALAKLLAER